MRIPLDHINASGHPPFFVGTRKRLATCTSVRFVNPHRLACASLVGQRLYLVSFHAEREWHSVLHSLPTTFGGAPACTDLLDFDGCDLLATSNCNLNSASLYRRTGDRIEHLRDVRIADSRAGFSHSARFVPSTDLLCIASQTGARGFYLVVCKDGRVVHHFADGDWIPKDAVFIDAQRMLAILSYGHAARTGHHRRGTKLALVAFGRNYASHVVEREWILDIGQCDCIAHAAGEVLLTDQGGDCVHHFRLEGQSLSACGTLKGFSFPHGLDFDIARRMLAVTNYGRNDVELQHL